MLFDCRGFEVEREREGAVKALGLVDTPVDDPRFNAITKWVLMSRGGAWTAMPWPVRQLQGLAPEAEGLCARPRGRPAGP